MKTVDTNLLVRIVTRDDEQRANAVDAFLAVPGQTCFIPVTVALELESVLRYSYKLKRPAMSAAFNALLSNAALVFEHEGAIEAALDTMESTKAGFPDGLHLALSIGAGHTPFVTMDLEASRLFGAERLAG